MVIAHDRPHVVFLVHRSHHRAAQANVIEWRVDGIEPHDADIALRIGRPDHDLGVLAQHRHEVLLSLFIPIDLSGLQRGGRGGCIRDDLPLDTLELCNLAAGGPFRGLLPRHVAIELLPGRAAARHVLVLQKPERSRTDDLRHRLERIGLRQPLRHDEGSPDGDRIDQQRERPLQRDLDGLVVREAPRIHRLRRGLSERVAHRPARQARRAVLRAHRLAVVEFQPIAQLDQIGEAVVGNRVALGHLRLRLLRRVHAEQRVPHHPSVVDGHRSGGDDRIQHGQVRLRHELQHARIGRLRNGEPRKRSRRNASRSGPQE